MLLYLNQMISQRSKVLLVGVCTQNRREGLLVGGQVCQELLYKPLIVSLIEKIGQHLQTHDVSVVPSFLQSLSLIEIARLSQDMQVIVALSNVFEGAGDVSFGQLAVDADLEAVANIL